MHRARWIPLILLAGVVCWAFPARAGQVRINVNSSFFDPDDVSLNFGDQVVWVWVGNGHTVTSGTSPGADGLFATAGQLSVLSGGGTAFPWKASVNGNRNYFCVPHAAFMQGILRISASGAAVSDFRITEVEYGNAGGLDRIEITNMGDAAGDLGRYRLSISDVPAELDIVPVNTLSVPVGGRVTIHTNETGVNTATHVFMGGTGGIGNLPTTGSVALYVPYRVNSLPASGTTLTASTIVDFVQWGGASLANSANAAAFWDGAEFVSGESLPGYSISFCGTRAQRGPAFWSVTNSNFGTSGICTTDAVTTTWGRIKTLYR